MRKGIKKQPKITIDGSLQENQFANCLVSINGTKSIEMVSSLDHESLIRKCERHVKECNTIDVKIIKKYDKIMYKKT